MRKYETIKALYYWRKPGRYNPDKEREATPELAMYLASHEREFAWWLPTEAVVRTPKIVTPRHCGLWDVRAADVRLLTGWNELWWPDRVERTSEWMGKMHTSSCSNDAYLIEDWQNGGDDGHTEYRLVGWYLLERDDAHKLTEGVDGSSLLSYQSGWRYDGVVYEILHEGVREEDTV